MKRKPTAPPRIKVADVVRSGHGDIFADAWYESSCETGEIWEACGETRLMTWPNEESNRETEAQAHYHDIVSEICERTFHEARQAISEAFVRIATEVLNREREP